MRAMLKSFSVVLVFGLAACGGHAQDDAGSDALGDTSISDVRDGSVTDATDAMDAVSADGDDASAEDAALDAIAPDEGSDAAALDAVTDVSRVDAALDGSAAVLCVATGGTLDTARCCAATGDFPNTCAIGGCSCSPTSSHDVMTCNCAGNQCFEPGVGCHAR